VFLLITLFHTWWLVSLFFLLDFLVWLYGRCLVLRICPLGQVGASHPGVMSVPVMPVLGKSQSSWRNMSACWHRIQLVQYVPVFGCSVLSRYYLGSSCHGVSLVPVIPIFGWCLSTHLLGWCLVSQYEVGLFHLVLVWCHFRGVPLCIVPVLGHCQLFCLRDRWLSSQYEVGVVIEMSPCDLLVVWK